LSTEIILKHKDIEHPVGICDVTEREFKKKDMDIHVNEVTEVTDDFQKGVRRLTVKNTKYHFINSVPWHREEGL
jgi:hypothetical protein